MKLSYKLCFSIFLYAVLCITPQSIYSRSPSHHSPTTVALISAFSLGSVLGTFWGYVDSVVPGSLRYITTFPAACLARIMLVHEISRALKKEAMPHNINNLFLATWLCEWLVYQKISR